MLWRRNPEWGLPDIDVLRQLAFGNGIRLERIVSPKVYFSVTSNKMLTLIHCLFVYRLRWRIILNASSSGKFKAAADRIIFTIGECPMKHSVKKFSCWNKDK